MASRRAGTPASCVLLVLACWAVCGAFAKTQTLHPAEDTHTSRVGAQAAVHRRLLNSSTPAASTKASTPLAGPGNSTAGHNSHPATKAAELVAAGPPKNGSQPQPAVKAAAQGTPPAKQLPVPAAALNGSVPKQQHATTPAAAHSQNSTAHQQPAVVQNHGVSSGTKPAAAVAPLSTGASESTAHTPSADRTPPTPDLAKQLQQPTTQLASQSQSKPGKDMPSAPSTQNHPTEASAQAVGVQVSSTAATAVADDYEVVPESEQATVFGITRESAQPANAVDAGEEGVAEQDEGAYAYATTEESADGWADSWEDAGDAEADGVYAQGAEDGLDADADSEEWHVTWTSTASIEDVQGGALADDYVDVTSDSPAQTGTGQIAARANPVAPLATDAADDGAEDANWESLAEAETQATSAEEVKNGIEQTQEQHEDNHSAAKQLLAASRTAADTFVATAASYRSRKSESSASSSASVASRKASPYSFLYKPTAEEEEEEVDAVSEWFRQNKIKPKVSKAKPYHHETPKKQKPQYQSMILSTTLYDASSVEPTYDDDSEAPTDARQRSYDGRRGPDVREETTYSRAELGYGSQSVSNLARGAVSIVGDEKWRLINIEKEEDIRWLRTGVKEYNRNHKKPVFVLAWVP